MHESRTVRPPVTGGASLLVIFSVLCLTVFALLGLSTAQAGSRLSQQSAQAVADYYAADCQAEEIFAQLRAGQIPSNVTQNGPVYTYSCPVSATQQLFVALQKEPAGWTVLRWQTASTADWEAEDALPVWNGT